MSRMRTRQDGRHGTARIIHLLAECVSDVRPKQARAPRGGLLARLRGGRRRYVLLSMPEEDGSGPEGHEGRVALTPALVFASSAGGPERLSRRARRLAKYSGRRKALLRLTGAVRPAG